MKKQIVLTIALLMVSGVCLAKIGKLSAGKSVATEAADKSVESLTLTTDDVNKSVESAQTKNPIIFE